jgi:hypothetical protein
MSTLKIGATYRQLKSELDLIPNNNDVTAWHCNPNRFSGVYVFDGKFVKVKGYDSKIPFLWGIDYHTHDFPICIRHYKRYF